jgi:hypothetical protein
MRINLKGKSGGKKKKIKTGERKKKKKKNKKRKPVDKDRSKKEKGKNVESFFFNVPLSLCIRVSLVVVLEDKNLSANIHKEKKRKPLQTTPPPLLSFFFLRSITSIDRLI